MMGDAGEGVLAEPYFIDHLILIVLLRKPSFAEIGTELLGSRDIHD
jgi:hypothetical protein